MPSVSPNVALTGARRSCARQVKRVVRPHSEGSPCPVRHARHYDLRMMQRRAVLCQKKTHRSFGKLWLRARANMHRLNANSRLTSTLTTITKRKTKMRCNRGDSWSKIHSGDTDRLRY